MPPDLGSPGGRMQAFVASLLRREGALVEEIEPEGLEVLAPLPVQRALGIGELARLGFGSTLPPGGQRVGLESDWLGRFGDMLGGDGRWSRRLLQVAARAPDDPERMLGQTLLLDNATYRLLGAAPAWTRYLVLDFRVSAISDDKRDFMLRLGINLATGTVPDAIVAALTLSFENTQTDAELPDATLPDNAELPAIWDRTRVLALVSRALPPRLDAALDPFVRGLRRRHGRDEDRLHRYHGDLHREAMLRALALPDGDLRRLREEKRAASIAREYDAKLDDLARQYATRVTVNWVQTLELAMPVHRYTVQLRRRKADRILLLDWNPLARRLEPPICEASFSVERPRLVCDDALHLVVPAALASCQECDRAFCRACHPRRCPKCGGGTDCQTRSVSIAGIA